MEKWVLEELARVVGPDGVRHPPDRPREQAIVLPRSTEEVVEIVRLANEMGFTISIRGAGTGFRPLAGRVVLDLCQMKRVKEVNPADLYLVAEPGATVADLNAATEKIGFFYPVAAEEESTIGGNVGVNAVGLTGLRYGETRDYTLALEVVTPAGEVMRTGARTFKSVTGYDTTRLLVGSRGRLGVVTEVTVRLVVRPEASRSLMAIFDGPEPAFRAAQGIIDAGIVPAKLEFMDSSTRSAVSQESGFALLAELHGLRQTVADDFKRAKALCREGAVGPAGEEVWWARRRVVEALSIVRGGIVVLSVVLPRDRLANMYQRSQGLSKPAACFGHLGAGILHIAVPVDSGEIGRAREIVEEMVATAVDLGGRVKDVHSIGLEEMKWPPLRTDGGTQRLQRSIERAVDPLGIMS